MTEREQQAAEQRRAAADKRRSAEGDASRRSATDATPAGRRSPDEQRHTGA